MNKILRSAGIVCVLCVVAVFLFKDALIKTVMTQVGSEVLGAPLEIKQFSWGIFTQRIVIKDLKIYDPPGFEKIAFVDVPQVTVRYDIREFIRNNYHLPLILVDLKEMVVVRNREGKLNVDALKVLHPEKKEKLVIPPFQIDELKLSIGRVIYKNYFKRDNPEVLMYGVGLKDKSFKNLDSVQKLVTVILVQGMGPTAIKDAGVYAAATLMGAGFLPAAVLGAIIAQDSMAEDLPAGFDKVFALSEKFIKERGLLKKSEKATGSIVGQVDNHDLKFTLEKLPGGKTRLTVSAHRFLLPRREFAGGVLYQISQGL